MTAFLGPRSWTAGILTIGLMVSACATPTAYQPLDPRDRASGGYSEQRIESNRFRVVFRGNSMTSRETVETYLLYRAAELTLANGYDWFVMADRDTERHSNTYVDRPFGAGRWGYWGPRWSYYGHGFGWRSWDPYWGDPFWGDTLDVRTVERYEANAEIVMGRGTRTPDQVRTFNAREVIDNLRDHIIVPR